MVSFDQLVNDMITALDQARLDGDYKTVKRAHKTLFPNASVRQTSRTQPHGANIAVITYEATAKEVAE